MTGTGQPVLLPGDEYKMTTKFAIISIPRTGSSYLVTSLQKHPEVTCHGEIFHPKVEWHILDNVRDRINLMARNHKPIEFVNEILDLDLGNIAVGFKIFKGHNDKALDYILKESSIKKIILKRNNIIASFSSLKLAQETNIWNVKYKMETSHKSIQFDGKEFKKYYHEIQKIYAYYKEVLEATNQSYLSISYAEHIMTNRIDVVYDFLCLNKKTSCHSDFQKLYTSDILARFGNPEEVITWLERNGHTDWLKEI